jgi:predicted O-linked N-acetylglucosamine transferase (SPINDLY family)
METLASALDWYRRGDLLKAEAACVQVLSHSSDHTDALALLADIHLAADRAVAALPLLTRVTQMRPLDASAHRRLGGALLSLARAREAADILREAIELEPKNPRAHNNLGQALMQLGEIADAIASYDRAIECDPNYAIGHSNLGLAWNAHADPARAEACFRRAIALAPTLAAAHINLALLFEKRNQLFDALASYDRAIAHAPGQFEARVGRGSVLAKLNRLQAALQCFDSALNLKEDALTLARKASVLLSMERGADALNCADHALRLEPDLAEGFNIRAGALRQLNRHAEALRCFERALNLDPAFVDGWCNRGLVAHEIGDTESAVASYRQALALDPHCVQARTRLLGALIPAVPRSAGESIQGRIAFAAELEKLEHWFEVTTLDEGDAFTAARQQFFYLSYREESNKALLGRYRRASSVQIARLYPSPESFPPTAAPNAVATRRSLGKFKLGFFSAHVFDHSVFNAILKGWLHRLDRSRFELTLFSAGVREDAMTRVAAASVDHFETGARTMSEWVRSIGERNLDALIYPEIGMNEITLALASLRLAERQFAAWGHPETSGLPAIDAYLSADAFEPPNAQEHYCERLIPLPHLGVYVERLAAPTAALDFAVLGIPRDRPLFVCPGVPFKYQPQDDHVLVEIARRLGSCTFLFFNHDKAELSHKLQARIAAAFRESNLDPGRYLVAIPWQPRSSFQRLLQQADVYLDTIGFSGFNTMMQAVESHLPCVAYEGRFMRGRLGSGIVRRLGLPELIAATKAQYVDIAVKLGESADYRAHLRERIRSSEHSLYADMTAIDALSAALLQSRH